MWDLQGRRTVGAQSRSRRQESFARFADGVCAFLRETYWRDGDAHRRQNLLNVTHASSHTFVYSLLPLVYFQVASAENNYEDPSPPFLPFPLHTMQIHLSPSSFPHSVTWCRARDAVTFRNPPRSQLITSRTNPFSFIKHSKYLFLPLWHPLFFLRALAPAHSGFTCCS